MNEIKVGEWTLTEPGIGQLHAMRAYAEYMRSTINEMAVQCVYILGIDPTTDTIARDICEEIVLHGTPVEEVVAKLQRHLEGGQ
jgi:hypothetical protein